MTTKTASAELEGLQRARDKAQAKAREAKAKRSAWDDDTEKMRWALMARANAHPDEFEGVQRLEKPGTEAAKFAAEIKQRMRSPNPHQGEYDEALAEYHRLDEELADFKRAHLYERLAEIDASDEIETIRRGHELVAEGAAGYLQRYDEVRAVLLDTFGGRLDGRRTPSLVEDERVAQWAREGSLRRCSSKTILASSSPLLAGGRDTCRR